MLNFFWPYNHCFLSKMHVGILTVSHLDTQTIVSVTSFGLLRIKCQEILS